MFLTRTAIFVLGSGLFFFAQAAQKAPSNSGGEAGVREPPPPESTYATVCQDQIAQQKELVYKGAEGIVPPKPIHTPDPKYPKTVVKAKTQGTVVLCLIVTPDGRVGDAMVSRHLSPDLDEAALKTVGSWTFAPATKDGKPVACQVSAVVYFKVRW